MLITSVCREECGRKPYNSIFKGNSESSGELNARSQTGSGKESSYNFVFVFKNLLL